MHKGFAIPPQPWGRRSRSWMMVLCLCALKFMDPFSFAVPKKQLGSQMQRQKDGLLVHTPVDGSFNSAINYPGVTIEVTAEEERLTSQLQSIAKGRRRGGWKEVKQLLSKYTGYSAVVFTAAMQAALKCRRYLEGAKMFERLRDVEAPIDAPVYVNAMKLYGKLNQESPVRELWAELQRLDLVDKIGAQARIDAAADNGDVDSAREVMAYMEKKEIAMDELHFSSAIHACANSNDKNRARTAADLFDAMLDKGLKPNIVTFSSLVRSLKGSPSKDLLDVLANMKVQGVKANKVFAENFMFIFLKQPSKGCWMEEDAITADLQKLDHNDLKVAKDVLDEFKASGVDLNRSCRLIDNVLTSLLR